MGQGNGGRPGRFEPETGGYHRAAAAQHIAKPHNGETGGVAWSGCEGLHDEFGNPLGGAHDVSRGEQPYR